MSSLYLAAAFLRVRKTLNFEPLAVLTPHGALVPLDFCRWLGWKVERRHDSVISFSKEKIKIELVLKKKAKIGSRQIILNQAPRQIHNGILVPLDIRSGLFPPIQLNRTLGKIYLERDGKRFILALSEDFSASDENQIRQILASLQNRNFPESRCYIYTLKICRGWAYATLLPYSEQLEGMGVVLKKINSSWRVVEAGTDICIWTTHGMPKDIEKKVLSFRYRK